MGSETLRTEVFSKEMAMELIRSGTANRAVAATALVGATAGTFWFITTIYLHAYFLFSWHFSMFFKNILCDFSFFSLSFIHLFVLQNEHSSRSHAILSFEIESRCSVSSSSSSGHGHRTVVKRGKLNIIDLVGGLMGG